MQNEVLVVQQPVQDCLHRRRVEQALPIESSQSRLGGAHGRKKELAERQRSPE
jgi:hypothetical protein